MNRRRFLTAKEVQAMMQAARQGPTGERDYCLILLAFRHGMRISELLDLHYHDLDLHEGRVNVRRLKNGFRRFIHCVLMSARRLSAEPGPCRLESGGQNGRTLFISAAAPRSPASRRIVLFAPPGKMRVPSRTLTPICCVTPAAAMNWRKRDRYAFDTGLSRTSQYSSHSTLHRQ